MGYAKIRMVVRKIRPAPGLPLNGSGGTFPLFQAFQDTPGFPALQDPERFSGPGRVRGFLVI
jgi:hypothetical protein